MSNQNQLTVIYPRCQSFMWDWKESRPAAEIEAALAELGEGYQEYFVDTGYDEVMCILAPSQEWAIKFQAEWDKAMATDDPLDPEYIVTELVDRETVEQLELPDAAELPF